MAGDAVGPGQKRARLNYVAMYSEEYSVTEFRDAVKALNVKHNLVVGRYCKPYVTKRDQNIVQLAQCLNAKGVGKARVPSSSIVDKDEGIALRSPFTSVAPATMSHVPEEV